MLHAGSRHVLKELHACALSVCVSVIVLVLVLVLGPVVVLLLLVSVLSSPMVVKSMSVLLRFVLVVWVSVCVLVFVCCKVLQSVWFR